MIRLPANSGNFEATGLISTAMTLTLSEPDASLSAIAGTSEADHSVAMMPSRREIAAHHEAGHAVTALAFRVPVRSASIRPRKATFGRVITPRLPDKDVDIEIYIALAGPFAHRRFAPGSNWLTGDFAIAEKLFGKGLCVPKT